MGQGVSIGDVADKVEADINKDHDNVFIPTVFVMKNSRCSGEQIKASFRNSPEVISIRFNNVQAEIAEGSRDERSTHCVVYETIIKRLQETATTTTQKKHWFFVYHPENMWYDDFATYAKERTPNREGDMEVYMKLYDRFCGFTDQIDTMILFMREARRLISEIESKKKKNPPIQLHLLIPTNQRLVIDEAIRFPNSLGDFVVEAPGRGLVQLNLPESQRSDLRGIASYTGDASYRTLGTAQRPDQGGN